MKTIVMATALAVLVGLNGCRETDKSDKGARPASPAAEQTQPAESVAPPEPGQAIAEPPTETLEPAVLPPAATAPQTSVPAAEPPEAVPAPPPAEEPETQPAESVMLPVETPKVAASPPADVAPVEAAKETVKQAPRESPQEPPNPADLPAPAGTVTIEAETFALTEADVIDDPRASGGKAVLLNRENGGMEGKAELPAGTYQILVIGKAPNSRQDALSFMLASADRNLTLETILKRISIPVPGKERLAPPATGPGAESAPKRGPYAASPGVGQVTLPAAGKVRVTFRVENERGMAIDKVEFRPLEK